MIRSMTGFGKAEQTTASKVFQVEIRSLNGKQLDVNLKAPPVLKPYEIAIRNTLKQKLIRGSLDVTIQIAHNGVNKPMEINHALARSYYKSIHTLATELHLPQGDLISALLKLPDVVMPVNEELAEQEWQALQEVLEKAIEMLDSHRQNEGQSLADDLFLRITNIERYQKEIQRLAPQRSQKMRQRLEQALQEWSGKEQVDQNRLEQELVFYIEKFDISEEQVRLINHCNYFKETMAEEDTAKGKKLNFILQEIGREINTTGAKANDAELQRYVVKMKDELEKGKEQIMNVL